MDKTTAYNVGFEIFYKNVNDDFIVMVLSV